MEILQRYRELARNNTFTHKNCWINLKSQASDAIDFLGSAQKRTNLESRISQQELRMSIKDIGLDLQRYDGLYVKAVVYKANTGISFKSKPAGFTSNLAFLYYSSSSCEWFLYAYAHGRYVPQSLKLTREKPSGYYVFISINEKKMEVNRPIPDPELELKS